MDQKQLGIHCPSAAASPAIINSRWQQQRRRRNRYDSDSLDLICGRRDELLVKLAEEEEDEEKLFGKELKEEEVNQGSTGKESDKW